MNHPYVEFTPPAAALIERFNTFVAQHVGCYTLEAAEVEFKLFTPEEPNVVEYDVAIREPIQVNDEILIIHTHFNSYKGQIAKSVEGETQREREAYEKVHQEIALEVAVEMALTGEEDYHKAINSWAMGQTSFTQEESEELLRRLLSYADEGLGFEPADANEVAELLDRLQRTITVHPAGE